MGPYRSPLSRVVVVVVVVDIDAQAARDSTGSDTWSVGVILLLFYNGSKLRTEVQSATDGCRRPNE